MDCPSPHRRVRRLLPRAAHARASRGVPADQLMLQLMLRDRGRASIVTGPVYVDVR